MRSTSPGSLIARSASTIPPAAAAPPRRDERDPLGDALAQPRVPPHGDVVVLEPDAQLALRPAGGQRLEELGWRLLAVEVLDLLTSLLDVPEVGDEAAQARSHHGEPVGPGEA